MTEIGKINVPQRAHAIEPKEETKKSCDCKACEEDDTQKKSTNLNESPDAVIGKSMVKKAPYKFDPEKVKSDIETYRENAPVLNAFKKEVQDSYEQAGMSPEAADHWSSIAAQCLQSPIVYNR